MEENHGTSARTKHVVKPDRITAWSTFALAVLGIGTLLFAWIQINAMREGTQRQIKEMHDEATGQINEMREEARGQHLTAMMDKYDSPAFQSVRKSLAEHRILKIGKTKRLHNLADDDEDYPPEFDQELQLCDNIGLLTDRGYLDRHDVWYAFGQWLFFLREDARPYLDSLSGPADYQKCVSLVDSIAGFEEKENKGGHLHPSETDLIVFYQSDIDTLPGQTASRVRVAKKP